MRFRNVEDIAAWRLCLGCGACAWACAKGSVRLADVIRDGIRPTVIGDCADCSDCVSVCPGIETSHGPFPAESIKGLSKGWGPVLAIWEGHAADKELRYRGSSGGAASALALYCLTRLGASGVLHSAQKDDEPWRNRTFFSTTAQELLARSGSRYSPASPCEGLGSLERAPSPGVFIGKPCDAAALRKAQERSPALKANTALSISIFCAGTPSTLGTIELLNRLKVRAPDLKYLRYRGMGWPGMWTAGLKDKGELRLTYKEAWGFLQKYRPFRCHLCPDGTGEFADVSCGDPWYRVISPDEPGLSLIIARTPEGKRTIEAAERDGFLNIREIDPGLLAASQENLLKKRSAIWGRLAAMRLLGAPRPKLRGFSLLRNWLGLSMREKLKSLVGTARRVIRRKYWRPIRRLEQKAGRNGTKHQNTREA